jgi:hypothetical protein
MSRSALLVEWRVEKRSSASSRIATYTCDSCGRIATSVRAEKLSHCCKRTTHSSVEIVTEIPIPKCEFGTDFIAVVCRGWVVDLLLASGRSSVHSYLWDELERVQAYVDRITCSSPHTGLPTEEALDESDFVPEGKQLVWCNQCEMLSINGEPCHESRCPNVHKVWDPNALPLDQVSHPDRQYGEWVPNPSEIIVEFSRPEPSAMPAPVDSRQQARVNAIPEAPEAKEHCYDSWSNWATWNVALLIDNSESTLNTKKRLAMNALKKGIGVDRLANQFQSTFKKQEDEVRQHHEDNAADARDRRGLYERQQLEGSGMVEPFHDQEGTSDWEKPMEEINWREIAWAEVEGMEMDIRAQNKKRAPEDTKHDKHPPEFRFRLNGEIMPEIFVQRALVDGEPVGQWEIEVDVYGIGRFTIDDNSNLCDPALSQFVLEFRDETSWDLLPIPHRQASVDKGWHRTTPNELVEILQSAGAFKTESNL